MDKLNHPIDLNHITPEQAIQRTIEMWSDMKDALGETPTAKQRYAFKRDWLLAHGYRNNAFPYYTTTVSSECFLCECSEAQWEHNGFRYLRCSYCPIRWPDEGRLIPSCKGNTLDYSRTPISDILAYIQDEKNRR